MPSCEECKRAVSGGGKRGPKLNSSDIFERAMLRRVASHWVVDRSTYTATYGDADRAIGKVRRKRPLRGLL